MSRNLSQNLQDHLTVIIAECDLLEDTFATRTDVMTRVNVIRNAAHRVANAIEGQSWPAMEMLAGTPSDSCLRDGR